MRILPDYEHMEYRDVYTCRTYPAPSPAPASASVASTAEVLPVGPVAQAGLLGFCWFSPPEWWPRGSYTDGLGFRSRFGFGAVASTSVCCCVF